MENNLLNIHPKIQQLQNQHHWFLTLNIWSKCGWCNTWKMTGIHSNRNWWTATRVITWDTTSNVRSFLAWNFRKVKIFPLPGCWVGKWLGVPPGFKIFNTLGIDFFVYYFIILLFFHIGLQFFSVVTICCDFVEVLYMFFQALSNYDLSFLSTWHYTCKCR